MKLQVPNIWKNEDLDLIANAMRPFLQQKGIPATKIALQTAFLRRVRQNLHVVICMSPIGDAIRTRLRMFPSLVNCCTIDWFHEWPEEALRSVARNFIASTQLLENDQVNLLILSHSQNSASEQMHTCYYVSYYGCEI